MTDEEDSTAGALVFNRIVTLRDTWTGERGEALQAEGARSPELNAGGSRR